MCALIAADALAAYPDNNKWFDVYIDASKSGTCIVQEDHPVPTFPLSKSQQNYILMEKEMLSNVASLDEI
ncbi:LOW QUALITY PROTEIN: hypothetical protein ACHAW6_015522 [Cyclotella cf. meneghiniana]